ncbi:hypothetical protein ACVWZ7_002775 [Arthrobacter sp. TE12232]
MGWLVARDAEFAGGPPIRRKLTATSQGSGEVVCLLPETSVPDGPGVPAARRA